MSIIDRFSSVITRCFPTSHPLLAFYLTWTPLKNQFQSSFDLEMDFSPLRPVKTISSLFLLSTAEVFFAICLLFTATPLSAGV